MAFVLYAFHNDNAFLLLVYMFHKDLGGNAVNIYGFHIQVICHNCLRKLVHLLYKAKKILTSDMDKIFSQIEDILHKHQHDKLAHMYDYHMAVFSHILDHSAIVDLRSFFQLLFCHKHIFVYWLLDRVDNFLHDKDFHIYVVHKATSVHMAADRTISWHCTYEGWVLLSYSNK